MVQKQFQVVAGDTESDQLAATIVRALRREMTRIETGYSEEEEQPLHASLEPRFCGAGGPYLAAEGVELAFDATHLQSIRSKLRRLLRFRRAFRELYDLAVLREPHAIIGVGFFGFNLRLAHAIKRYVREEQGTFFNWEPKIIQMTVPEGWTERGSRIGRLSQDIDCLLTANAEEKHWYAEHAPHLRTEFLGDAETLTVSELAQAAAEAICRVVLEEEAHFPLRAYLSHPQSP